MGNTAPCIALAQHIKFHEKGIEPIFVSYGIGFKMLEYYDLKKIDLNYFSKGSIYPGLKMNDGIYPNFNSVIKKINLDLVINCGEIYVPKYCCDNKIPCVSIINLSYFVQNKKKTIFIYEELVNNPYIILLLINKIIYN